ncbi:hypothetical protein QR721_03710 [Aciduricibacillus chroicocephali]|uniref:DUF47 family protein n=1 Tax=Aciduricibacillus chroicocephali TaxID=3054939 RepID=A0ABY9KWW4_9BACI|nr:hypothetical protein QR721_03710 [Bacillaceae bacterium 44XB]
MLLVYKNTKRELSRDDTVFLKVFQQVNELIAERDVVLSHLIVDGVDVYENHEAFINERLSEIMRIEIVTKSAASMIYETMDSIHEYLDRAIPALNELVDNSFESFDSETWDGINLLAEGMQWVLQFASFVNEQKRKPDNWNAVEKAIFQCELSFKQLMEGVVSEDTVLISDILLYEIAPAYEELKNSLKKSLQDKEFFKDAH